MLSARKTLPVEWLTIDWQRMVWAQLGLCCWDFSVDLIWTQLSVQLFAFTASRRHGASDLSYQNKQLDIRVILSTPNHSTGWHTPRDISWYWEPSKGDIKRAGSAAAKTPSITQGTLYSPSAAITPLRMTARCNFIMWPAGTESHNCLCTQNLRIQGNNRSWAARAGSGAQPGTGKLGKRSLT